MLALLDDRSFDHFKEDYVNHTCSTHQMRSYGMYLYGPRGQEVLFAALRGHEEDDDTELPLRP